PLACAGHVGSVRNVKFSPQNNNIFATTGNDAKVNLWQVAQEGEQITCSITKTLDQHAVPVWGLDFSQDGQQIISAGENVILWNVEKNYKTVIKGHKGRIWNVAFNPADNEFFATAGADGSVRLWDIGNKSGYPPLKLNTRARDIDFSPLGDRMVTGGSNGTIRFWDWDAKTNQLKSQPAITCKGHDNSTYGVSLSRDGSLLAAGVEDGKLYLWDIVEQNCTLRGTWQANEKAVHSVAFHPQNDNLLATAGQDGSIRLWEIDSLKKGETQAPLPAFQGHRGEASQLSFNHDGSWLATVGTDGVVRVWHVARLLEQLVNFSNHNQQQMRPKDLQEKVQENSLLFKCTGNQQWVLSTDFHPEQNLLVSADAGGTVILWDLIEPTQKKCQKRWERTLSRDDVYGVKFSPDGNTIAVGDRDGSARLWDLDGNQLGEFPGHTSTIWSVEFSPDGQSLLTSDNSYTLRQWPIEDLDALVEKGCNWAKHYLSRSPDGDLCKRYIEDTIENTTAENTTAQNYK
ncbi:MAG: WD40 repeat domain-containing protein, partial [Cyanobacteria bacterium J06598_3]